MNDAAALILRMRRAVLDFENQHGRARTEPFELTTAQFEQLKAANKVLYPAEGAPNAFYGVRIVIKD
jgi:hypothetical protein